MELVNLLEEFKEIFCIIKEVNIEKFNGYYVLFFFDGDNMGKWLSGVNFEDGYNKGEVFFDFY